MNYDDIVAYAKKIGVAFTRGDIELILSWAQEDASLPGRRVILKPLPILCERKDFAKETQQVSSRG